MGKGKDFEFHLPSKLYLAYCERLKIRAVLQQRVNLFEASHAEDPTQEPRRIKNLFFPANPGTHLDSPESIKERERGKRERERERERQKKEKPLDLSVDLLPSLSSHSKSIYVLPQKQSKETNPLRMKSIVSKTSSSLQSFIVSSPTSASSQPDSISKEISGHCGHF